MDAWDVWWAQLLVLGPVGLVALMAGLQLAGLCRVIPWWCRTLLFMHVLAVLNNLWVISRLAG